MRSKTKRSSARRQALHVRPEVATRITRPLLPGWQRRAESYLAQRVMCSELCADARLYGRRRFDPSGARRTDIRESPIFRQLLEMSPPFEHLTGSHGDCPLSV